MAKELIAPEQFCKVQVTQQDMELELNEEQLKELAELYEGSLQKLSSGKLVTGTVVKADNDGVLVDIQYKSDGLIPSYEFSERELKKLTPGDDIEVILDELENINGNVVLSYEKAKALKAWDAITKLFEEEKPVEGVVTHKVKGGLSVDIGIPAFLPGSQIDLQRVTDFDGFIGQTITANILKINKKRGNVIISRRKYLGDQRTESRKQVLETLSADQVLQGVVKNITNYGAFIDIGGVDGLLHITDMTWGRISHPSEMVKLGDTVTVKILSFDKDNAKISLGIKQLEGNPWQDISETIKAGARVKGKISSITDYGLFVEIQKGIEGLVHISEISWVERISDLASKYKEGQEIEVLIVSLDKENRRMSLSVKQLDKNPWETMSEQFSVGQKIKGTVSNITDFGIFVQLVPGIDGLVHISDLSWTEHINHPADMYKKGDTVEATILSIDPEKKKISLGIKQLSQDPWEQIEKQYPVGTILDGEVSKIANFGAFVKLPSGIEGLLHVSDLGTDKIEDVLNVSETKQFRVVNVNKEERKLGLSLKLEGQVKREKPKSAKPSRERAPKSATTASNKPQKSAFQMALEEHAARNDDDKE